MLIEQNKFFIKSTKDNKPAFNKSFNTFEEAKEFVSKIPVNEYFKVEFNNPNKSLTRMLTEGLAKEDLLDILSPVISFDEYVPKNNNKNIVLGLYVLNEPLAVPSLQAFCDKALGVEETDSSDSETISNASVVYVEFKREQESKEYILALIGDLCILGGFKKEDILLMFPTSDQKFTFDPEIIDLFFKRLVK